jgi:hypothetical protein
MPSDKKMSLNAIRADLAVAEDLDAAESLPHLRSAADRLTALIDDSMAQALLNGRATLRSAGAGAGLSENAVGPRLARTRTLGAYVNDAGRVTAAGVQRAQYDSGNGTGRTTEQREPLRFKPRRRT